MSDDIRKALNLRSTLVWQPLSASENDLNQWLAIYLWSWARPVVELAIVGDAEGRVSFDSTQLGELAELFENQSGEVVSTAARGKAWLTSSGENVELYTDDDDERIFGKVWLTPEESKQIAAKLRSIVHRA